MNVVDLFMVVIVLLFLWLGWQKGFIAGARDLAIWSASLFIGFSYYQSLSVFLGAQFTSLGAWSKPVSFLALIIISRLLLSILFYQLLRQVEPQIHAHKLNKALGTIPGFIMGLLNAAIIAALLQLLPFPDSVGTVAKGSAAAEVLTAPIPWFTEKVSPIFEEAVLPSVAKKNIYPKTDETVKLPFTVVTTKPRQELEMEMIELVNVERAKLGLRKLTPDPALTPVARRHSQDMFARGYFSHYSLEGKTVSDRLKAAGIRFLTAGENLALAPTLSTAHNGLMNSPGHKANILHKAYGKIGIGIADGGIRGLMVTQVFKN
jgi:uncharacterized protein YkwD